MSVCFLGKIKATTVFMRVWLPALLGLSAALLPALSWGQSQSDIQTWQKTVQKTLPPSQAGCFQITYPATQWQSCPNVASPANAALPAPALGAAGTIVPQVGGYNQDGSYAGGYVATATGGPISSATGSFTNVTGTTSADAYSLQMNTNIFSLSDPSSTSLCNGSSICMGWVQFGYSDGVIGTGHTLISGNPCPSFTEIFWTQEPDGSDYACYSSVGEYYVGIQPLNTQISVFGQTANGMDTTILYNGQQAYAAVSPSVFKELPEQWQDVEFNVFGYGNGATANFSSGSSLTVKASIDNGTSNAPSCSLSGYTGESNNLYFSSPCCPYPGAADGTLPSIVFSEGSNPDGTNPGINSPACSFSGATFTPTYTLTAGVQGSGGTISPSGSVAAVSGTRKTFTFTPNPGYQASVVQKISVLSPNYAAGDPCGGTFTGNTYTTNPIYANCQVQAQFSPVVTASAGTGGTISPAGATAVTPGQTQTFTLTPNTGYQIASVGGTCGGTLSGTTYTTQPITAPCTVTAVFALYYTVTAYIVDANGIKRSTTSTKSIQAGQTATFVATAPLSSVSGTCGATLSNNNTTITTKPITANCTVIGVAGPLSYTVTASAGTGGTISPSGNVAVASGTTRTFTLTPSANYQVSSVGGTCGGTLSGNTYTTKAITAACTVTAVFAPATYYTVAAYVVDANGIKRSTTSTKSIQAGQTATFGLSAPLSSVSGTCGATLSNNNTTITTKPITANCTVIGVM